MFYSTTYIIYTSNAPRGIFLKLLQASKWDCRSCQEH